MELDGPGWAGRTACGGETRARRRPREGGGRRKEGCGKRASDYHAVRGGLAGRGGPRVGTGLRMAGWGAPACSVPRHLGATGAAWPRGWVGAREGGEAVGRPLHRTLLAGAAGPWHQHPPTAHRPRPLAPGSRVAAVVSRPFLLWPHSAFQGLLLAPHHLPCLQRKASKRAVLSPRKGAAQSFCFPPPQAKSVGRLPPANCPSSPGQRRSFTAGVVALLPAEPLHPLSFLRPQILPKSLSQTHILGLVPLAPRLPQRAVHSGPPHPAAPHRFRPCSP